jgi:hypothetical protein
VTNGSIYSPPQATCQSSTRRPCGSRYRMRILQSSHPRAGRVPSPRGSFKSSRRTVALFRVKPFSCSPTLSMLWKPESEPNSRPGTRRKARCSTACNSSSKRPRPLCFFALSHTYTPTALSCGQAEEDRHRTQPLLEVASPSHPPALVDTRRRRERASPPTAGSSGRDAATATALLQSSAHAIATALAGARDRCHALSASQRARLAASPGREGRLGRARCALDTVNYERDEPQPLLARARGKAGDAPVGVVPRPSAMHVSNVVSDVGGSPQPPCGLQLLHAMARSASPTTSPSPSRSPQRLRRENRPRRRDRAAWSRGTPGRGRGGGDDWRSFLPPPGAGEGLTAVREVPEDIPATTAEAAGRGLLASVSPSHGVAAARSDREGGLGVTVLFVHPVHPTPCRHA